MRKQKTCQAYARHFLSLEAAAGSLPGAGLVTAVMQRESCFLAGTSVTLGTGDKQAIETLRIGQRVLTPESAQSGPHSPLCGAGDSDSSETAVDPATWRSYTVRLRDGVTKWDVFDITLLRSAGWMEAQARQVEGHAEVWVDFEELNARGWAEVIEEAPCPPIAAGSGRVITATITHANDDVRTLTMSSGETLYVTGNHRMYSATQADWVPVKDLRIGEELQTTDGRKSVASLGYQKGRHQVYNIEVEAEHCYFVGGSEVLTHNVCKTHITYTMKNEDTGEVYSGRTSGTGTPEEILKKREAGHHMKEKGFSSPEIDQVSKNKDAIRGREQHLIDANGGAKSEGGTSGNAIRGVSERNKKADKYEAAANKEFGTPKKRKK